MCTPEKAKDKAHCRTCGGMRWHEILHNEARFWQDEETPISSSDTYQIVQCCGCDTISFRHIHWFSEIHDGAGNTIVNNDYYPPAPTRAIPDWEKNLLFDLQVDEFWISFLLKDIYAAVGLKSFSLAAMGARAIVDAIITSESGNAPNFRKKLDRLVEINRIDKARSDAIYAAFDAASATAHRGHSLDEADLFVLLTIMETLLYDFRVKPQKDKQEVKAAERLKRKTPPRPDRKTF